MGDRQTGAIVAGWLVGVVAAGQRWPHQVIPVLASGAAVALLALAAVELARLWWPRR